MTTNKCDKDSDMVRIINSAIRADVRMVKLKEVGTARAGCGSEDIRISFR